MVKEKIKKRSISIKTSILHALHQMDREGVKSLIVFEHNTFKGMITIGDIQRTIIKKNDLNQAIAHILDIHKTYAKQGDAIEDIKSLMMAIRAECMPILDTEGQLYDVLFWEDIISEKFIRCANPFDLPIVIMAGGKGIRLKPLTNILPKPLIPIGEKTLIEEIMDKFVACGSHRFFLSLNYKADFIQSYLEQQNNTAYCLTYFKENQPLGTSGSLALLKEKIKTTFFVSNCDILIDEDYSQILHYHKENQNELTLITALKSFAIPYGIVETKKDGVLVAIKEKPDVSFHINTGMYILEPHILQQIPVNQYYDITDLIQNIIKRAGRVGCFPISDKSWKDMGNWEDYLKIINNKQ